MKNNKFLKMLLTMVLCVSTFVFTGCVPQQTTNNPPAPVNPPPSTPDVGGGEGDLENPNTPDIDELFQGIKIISAGGNNLKVRDFNGDEKEFNTMLDRQIDAYAQDVLIRLIGIYGGLERLQTATPGVADYLKIKNLENEVYKYDDKEANVNIEKLLSNGKNEEDAHTAGGYININCENCMNYFWNEFSFHMDRSLNLKMAMFGGRKLEIKNYGTIQWKDSLIGTKDNAWIWKIASKDDNNVFNVMKDYLTQYKKVFKNVIAEILAYGQTKEYSQSTINFDGTIKGYSANFDYNATLNKIDHLGILANDSKNIKNFVFTQIIGENLVKNDNSRKPQMFNNTDVNLTTANFDLVAIKDNNPIFSTVTNAAKGEYYQLILNKDKTYAYNELDWQNNKKILSYGSYSYNSSTPNSLGLSFTQSETLGLKTTTGTIVKNTSDNKITLEAEIGNIGRKSFNFDGNGILSSSLGNVDITTGNVQNGSKYKDDDFTITNADGNPDLSNFVLSEKRFFSNYTFIISSILDRVQYHTFGNVGEAPNKNIDKNIEGESEEFVTLYPKMPKVVSDDKNFGELSDIGGSIDPDTGEKMPGIMFTEYQEFKSILYKPKKELICPELWLAFSAEKDMKVTLQVNFKYVANGKVLYNNILGSERNTTNDIKNIFVIEKDYNLVSKTKSLVKGFTPPGGAPSYPDVELPDGLKPDPNNRDYFFDFSLYEVIKDLNSNMFKQYSDNSSSNYNIWNSSFTTSAKTEGAGSVAGYNAGENYIEISFIILKAEKIVGSNYMPYDGPVKLSIGFGEPFV